MIKWMFIRGVYFICKFFPDIGKVIIALASNFFSLETVWLFTFILLGATESCFGLLSRLLIVSHVFLMSLLYLLNSL